MTIPKILVDPGHDKAKYNQSPVVSEYYEGERMWKLSQLLCSALSKRGIPTGMTKSKCDQALEVTARGKMAKGYAAMISMHSNACSDPAVDRPVGIYFVDDNCGTADDVSKDLAQLLANTVAKVVGTSPAQIYSKLSANDRDKDGKKNDDHYGVLYGAHQVGVPAVILEHSFHTNAKAAKWLMDDANLAKLAEAEADALAEYYGVSAPVATSPTAGYTVTLATLKEGDKGEQVKMLQALLRGYDCKDDDGKLPAADGDFGKRTKQALIDYQSRHNDSEGNPLKHDGVAGPKVWGSMTGSGK